MNGTFSIRCQFWDIIPQESRARGLDPYQVAGLIRQETVFNPRAGVVGKGIWPDAVAGPYRQHHGETGRFESRDHLDSLFEPRHEYSAEGTAYFQRPVFE
jgi:hypothetical protein